MAISGRFLADFESFYSAVTKAELQLRSFETGAGKVEKALNRAADSFSGRKIIQDATLAAEAVERIGGASKLTDSEQRRLNSTLTEAIEKYRALGQEAPKAMRDLADATKQIPAHVESIGSSLRNLGAMLGVTFSVGAVIGFGREILAMGDDIQRTADRTGLMTDEVQKLNFIAEQSGNTLDDLTSAVGQMQNRLASGDASAVGALKQLNLTFEDLARMDPYEQLQTIARGIAQIPNPANQAQVAMDLFGRTGIAILPTLKSEFDKLGNAAPVMSQKTVKALDDAGDALNKFKLTAKVFAAESYNFLGKVFDQGVAAIYRYVAGLLEGFEKIERAIAKLPGAGRAFPTLEEDIKGLAKNAQWFRDAAAMMTTQMQSAGAAAERVIIPMERLAKPIKEIVQHQRDHAVAVRAVKEESEKAIPVLSGLTGGFERIGEQIRVDIPSIKEWTIALREGLDSMPGLKTEVSIPTAPKKGGFSALFGDPQQFGQQMSQTIIGAIQGGGSPVKAAAGFAGSSIGSSIGASLIKDGPKFFQGALGKVFAGAMPVIGSLIGPLADVMWNKLFGTAGRDKVKEFVATFGGFDALHEKLNTLGSDGERLWIKLTQGVGRNNAQEAAKAIDEVTRAFANRHEEVIPTLSDMQAAAERYGGSLEALGPKVQEMRITEEAASILADLKLLEKGGADLGAVYDFTKDEVQALLKEAKATGADLPAALKPFLQEMINAGRLTDDAGNKLEDLSSFHFSEDLPTVLRDLTDTMKDFVGAITGRNGAIDALHQLGGVQIAPKHIKIFHDDEAGNAIPMARGGDFLVKRPTLFLAGEAGPERATFSGAGRTSAVVADAPTPIVLNIDGEEFLRTFVKLKKRYV